EVRCRPMRGRTGAVLLTAGIATIVALGACGSEDAGTPPGADAGDDARLDDALSAPDDAAPPDDGGGRDVDERPRVTFRWVADALRLPANSAAYALDLNGDGSRDNAYGGLVSLLLSQGLDGFAEV